MLCESFYVTSLLTRTLVPIHKQFGMYFFENIQVNYLQFGMARESTLQNATQRVNLRHRMPHSAWIYATEYQTARESTPQNAIQRVNLRHRMPHSAWIYATECHTARESTPQNATQRVNIRHRMPHSAWIYATECHISEAARIWAKIKYYKQT